MISTSLNIIHRISRSDDECPDLVGIFLAPVAGEGALVLFRPQGHVNRDASRPILRGHQALDTLSLASFQGHDEGKYSPRWKVITDCGPVICSYAAPFECLFQNKVMFLHDKPLRGQLQLYYYTFSSIFQCL